MGNKRGISTLEVWPTFLSADFKHHCVYYYLYHLFNSPCKENCRCDSFLEHDTYFAVLVTGKHSFL